MVMLALRFDLRNPAFAETTPSERLRAALDMAAWADTHGGVAISISEHHGSDDGYLPSPIVFAAALAARTTNVRISIAALLAPLYDPLRLAEDLAVLDNLSGGRVDLLLANGYVADEFAMFGVPMAERGRRTTEVIETLRKAWTGEPFTFRDRTVRVTPAPYRPGGPPIVLGGSTDAAARRAARIADGYTPSTGDSWPAYRAEMVALGKPDPGERLDHPMVVTNLAEDPESAWPELLPYFLHETNAYGDWLDGAGLAGPYRRSTPEEVRTGGQYRVITPDQHASELRAMGPAAFAFFQPMVGGVPPSLAWRGLELFETQVLPQL
jgi:alkanesulfonate monooxygenase SsuD/methylene tetrahydromethanopterin reductase-like flavin-dependent oxidoreductase (luciferase family)